MQGTVSPLILVMIMMINTDNELKRIKCKAIASSCHGLWLRECSCSMYCIYHRLLCFTHRYFITYSISIIIYSPVSLHLRVWRAVTDFSFCADFRAFIRVEPLAWQGHSTWNYRHSNTHSRVSTIDGEQILLHCIRYQVTPVCLSFCGPMDDDALFGCFPLTQFVQQHTHAEDTNMTVQTNGTTHGMSDMSVRASVPPTVWRPSVPPAAVASTHVPHAAAAAALTGSSLTPHAAASPAPVAGHSTAVIPAAASPRAKFTLPGTLPASPHQFAASAATAQ